MDDRLKTTAMRRGLIDLAILCAIGLLMGFLAPLSWDRISAPVRYLYWMVCISLAWRSSRISRSIALI
ncbi:hypothetical protein [Brevundimonas sp.]|uniref:hypothetical protein n=1 Tax=Brevundimonas sp. TaxID=1871086 RepID=UPI0025BB700C|nr:hypothetical protein [Brevundimonas sp.]